MLANAITLTRFNILAAYTRQPSAYVVGEEIEHFATDGDRVLGALIRDKIDGDYSGVVLGKDESGQYRCVHLLDFADRAETARARLVSAMELWHAQPDEAFFQGGPRKPFLDIFLPIRPSSELNPLFLSVANRDSFAPARRVIESMMPFFRDVDGNFIEQFQTTGFDARIWELYLFAALTERMILVDRAYNAPDYYCDFFGYTFFVEATTVNPSVKDGVLAEPNPASMDKDGLISYFNDYMPIKWGSALWSKLEKRYWELPHVPGRPIVLAVQDFHVPRSMSFSSGTLLPYLYGRKFSALYDPSGTLVIADVERQSHTWQGKTIPSGFFRQPGAENISAVVSNPLGTVSKFNRLGVGAGFGIAGARMILTGTKYDHAPNAAVPKTFELEVEPGAWDELWCCGLNVYHNPRALHPLQENVFGDCAQHFEIGGEIRSYVPEFHPLGVVCRTLVSRRPHD